VTLVSLNIFLLEFVYNLAKIVKFGFIMIVLLK